MSKTASLASLASLAAACDSADLSADRHLLQIYRTAVWDAQLAFDRLAKRVWFCRSLCQETLADLQSEFFHEQGDEFVQIGCIVMWAALVLLCDPVTATDSVCTQALDAVEGLEATLKTTQ
jgi:hypothetical protein